MTRKRAFWDATITVCGTNCLVWAILFRFLRHRLAGDDWLFVISISLLPLLLIIPVYRRNLRGRENLSARSPRHLLIVACMFSGVAILYAVGAIVDFKDLGARTNQ